MVSRGFALVEIVVALLLLSIGALAALTATAAAVAMRNRAAELERAVERAEAIGDSLLRVGTTGPGVDTVGTAVLAWRPDPDGALLTLTVDDRPLGTPVAIGRPPRLHVVRDP